MIVIVSVMKHSCRYQEMEIVEVEDAQRESVMTKNVLFSAPPPLGQSQSNQQICLLIISCKCSVYSNFTAADKP